MGSAYGAAARLVPPLGRLRRQRDELASALASAKATQAELEAELAAATEHRGREVEELKQRYGGPGGLLYPPGHFYSPLPDLLDIRQRAPRIFTEPDEIPEIDLRSEAQLALLEQVAATWTDWPYAREHGADLRYSPDNDYFGHVDGLVLSGLLHLVRPRRYVEVGSGWSSALVLDHRDEHLPELRTTFIEPYPDRLHGLLRPSDAERTEIVEAPVQDVDLAVFDELEPGDVLFIDSTHVSKIGSDVNFLCFEVLPRLPAGVWIHVHDIRYPFEYSPEWVFEGRAWNEAYLLRALLMGAPHWQIDLWASYLQVKHSGALQAVLPTSAKVDGASIWFRRTGAGGPSAPTGAAR